MVTDRSHVHNSPCSFAYNQRDQSALNFGVNFVNFVEKIEQKGSKSIRENALLFKININKFLSH